MKGELTKIEVVTSFPCLMEYKIQGTHSVGIYLVNDNGKNDDNKYSVCLVAPSGDDISNLGETYFKKDLNPKEWFHLPKGTKITLTN